MKRYMNRNQLSISHQDIQKQMQQIQVQNILFRLFNNEEAYKSVSIEYFSEILLYFIESGFIPINVNTIFILQDEVYLQKFIKPQHIITTQPIQEQINSSRSRVNYKSQQIPRNSDNQHNQQNQQNILYDQEASQRQSKNNFIKNPIYSANFAIQQNQDSQILKKVTHSSDYLISHGPQLSQSHSSKIDRSNQSLQDSIQKNISINIFGLMRQYKNVKLLNQYYQQLLKTQYYQLINEFKEKVQFQRYLNSNIFKDKYYIIFPNVQSIKIDEPTNTKQQIINDLYPILYNWQSIKKIKVRRNLVNQSEQSTIIKGLIPRHDSYYQWIYMNLAQISNIEDSINNSQNTPTNDLIQLMRYQIKMFYKFYKSTIIDKLKLTVCEDSYCQHILDYKDDLHVSQSSSLQQPLQVKYTLINKINKSSLNDKSNKNDINSKHQQKLSKRQLQDNPMSIRRINSRDLRVLRVSNANSLHNYISVPLDINNRQMLSILHINNLFMPYLLYLQNQNIIKYAKTDVINKQFRVKSNDHDIYHLRILQMIYTKLYGYNYKIMQIKSKMDFLLQLPPNKIEIFETQLKIYLSCLDKQRQCVHNTLFNKLESKQLTNDKQYQIIIKLLQEFAKKYDTQEISHPSEQQKIPLIKIILYQQLDSQISINSSFEPSHRQNEKSSKEYFCEAVYCHKLDQHSDSLIGGLIKNRRSKNNQQMRQKLSSKPSTIPIETVAQTPIQTTIDQQISQSITSQITPSSRSMMLDEENSVDNQNPLEIDIPVSFIDCQKCNQILICSHQVLTILLYDQQEQYDALIQNFTNLDNSISNDQYYCKICGQLLKQSVKFQDIQKIDKTKKTVYQTAQFQQVVNIYDIFFDLIGVIYEQVKKELVIYRDQVDYLQRKKLLIVIFISAYFYELQGRHIIVKFKTIYRRFSKIIPFDYNEFQNIVKETQTKYNIKSNLHRQSYDNYQKIKIIFGNKLSIKQPLNSIYDQIMQLAQTQQQISINLNEYYQINKYSSYFNKSIFDIEKSILQNILLANAINKSLTIDKQELKHKQQKSQLIIEYNNIRSQIAKSKINFTHRPLDYDILRKQLLLGNSNGQFLELASIKYDEIHNINQEFYPQQFYSQYCYIAIKRIISKNKSIKVINSSNVRIPSKDKKSKQSKLTINKFQIDTRQKQLLIDDDDNTIKLTIKANRDSERFNNKFNNNNYNDNDNDNGNIDVNILHRFVNVEQSRKKSRKDQENDQILQKCSLCGYIYGSDELVYDRQSFIQQFFFIYGDSHLSNLLSSQTKISPDRTIQRINLNPTQNINQLEYDELKLIKFCIDNGIKPMKLLNLGGFDYVETDKTGFLDKQFEIVIKEQIMEFQRRYQSFMKLRIGECKQINIPKNLEFVKKIPFDWSLFKNRYNKVIDYIRKIFYKLQPNNANIQIFRQFNIFERSLKLTNCSNYLVLTQSIIYHFTTQIIPQLTKNNNNIIQSLIDIIQYDQDTVLKDTVGIIYQKQRLRANIVDITQDFDELGVQQQDFDQHRNIDSDNDNTDYENNSDYDDMDTELLNIRNNNDKEGDVIDDYNDIDDDNNNNNSEYYDMSGDIKNALIDEILDHNSQNNSELVRDIIGNQQI